MSMLGARQLFRSFMKSSPALPYDAEVKWLESTGTQWIDTGVSIARDLYCEVKFCLTVEPGSCENAPFGANNGRVWLAFASRLGTAKGLYCGAYSSFTGYNVGGHVYVFDDMDWHVAKIDSTGGAYSASFRLDDNEAFARSAATGSVTNNMYLFGCNGTGITDRAKCRIGYCKIKSTTTNQLLIDIIPVRFTNELGESEGAMYDRVSGQLFRNQGTGKFIVGADAGMPYDCEVQYLESSGTQYIDTGVVGRDGLHIEAVATRDIVATAGKNVFGVVLGAVNFTLVSVNSSTGVITTGLNSVPGTTSSDVYLVQDNSFHSFVLDTTGGAKYAKVDGVSVRSLDSHGTAQAERGMIIFGARVINNTLLSSCRVASFSAADTATGGRLIELVPVSKDGVGYMYDTVSGNLLGNSGTGDFVAGPVVSNEGPVPYAYKVEYIETDGVASYIDTGCYAGINFQFDLDFQVASTPSSSAAIAGSICGARIGSKTADGYFELDISTTNNVFHFRNPSTSLLSDGIPYSLDRHTASCSYSGITFDGVSVTTTHSSTFDRHSLFFIGRAGVGNVIASHPERSYANVRVYSCVLRDNGVVVFNGIPVVDRNGVACMYDYISKTLKYNAAATGTITAGPPLV